MKRIARRLASSRLTLAGFALLAAGTMASYDRPGAPVWAIVAPLALLTLNLAAALATRKALREGGLGVFHFALLAFLLLAGWGRLTHFDGRVEVGEDVPLDPDQIETLGVGPWHSQGWRQLRFRQGSWDVAYAPGVKRARTRSQVWLEGQDSPVVVGDDTPLILDSYRFYTTHNKGFAPLLTWQPEGGAPLRGTLHMPSYPLFDYRQENRWTAPDGRTMQFWLRIERPLADQSAWTLDPHDMPAVLVVQVDAQRHELRPGESLQLPGATLRYERLTGWMGYRIFYDPTLIPLLVVSLVGVAGLAWHLWGRSARLVPQPEGVTV
jgi:cytochrome c biogenesis protein